MRGILKLLYSPPRRCRARVCAAGPEQMERMRLQPTLARLPGGESQQVPRVLPSPRRPPQWAAFMGGEHSPTPRAGRIRSESAAGRP